MTRAGPTYRNYIGFRYSHCASTEVQHLVDQVINCIGSDLFTIVAFIIAAVACAVGSQMRLT